MLPEDFASPEVFALSDWSTEEEEDNDEQIPEPSGFLKDQGPILPHRMNEVFQSRHNIDAPFRLLCKLDGQSKSPEMCLLSEIGDFEKLKVVIDSHVLKKYWVSVAHLDGFAIEYVDQAGNLISSNLPKHGIRYRAEKNTTRGTYNALMKAVSARLMHHLHLYCSCNDREHCKGAEMAPRIRLYLSSLDENNERVLRSGGRGQQKVKPDNVVGTGQLSSDTVESNTEFGPLPKEPKVIISAACLKRLLSKAKVGTISSSSSKHSFDQMLDTIDQDGEDRSSSVNGNQSSTEMENSHGIKAVVEVSDSESDEDPLNFERVVRKARLSYWKIRND